MRRILSALATLTVAAAFFTTPVFACPRHAKGDCPCKHHHAQEANAAKKKANAEPAEKAAEKSTTPGKQSAREQLNKLLAPIGGAEDALTVPAEARVDASAGVFI